MTRSCPNTLTSVTITFPMRDHLVDRLEVGGGEGWPQGRRGREQGSSASIGS